MRRSKPRYRLAWFIGLYAFSLVAFAAMVYVLRALAAG
jgi:hypothetical protein